MGFYDPQYEKYRKRRDKAARKQATKLKRIQAHHREHGIPIQRLETKIIHGQLVRVAVLPTMHAEGGWPGSQTKSWRRGVNAGRSNASNTITTGVQRSIDNREKQREPDSPSGPSGTSPEEGQRTPTTIRRPKPKTGHVGSWGA